MDCSRIHLLARLNRIAAVDAKGRRINGRGELAGGSAEPGKPRQPLVGRRYEFAAESVARRNQERVQTLAAHFFPQRRKTPRKIGRAHAARAEIAVRDLPGAPASNRSASCSVMAPASCSTSEIVTARP